MARTDLVDISTISIDPSLSDEQRVREMLHQVKNHLNFMCCGYEIEACYPNTNLTMKECVVGIWT